MTSQQLQSFERLKANVLDLHATCRARERERATTRRFNFSFLLFFLISFNSFLSLLSFFLFEKNRQSNRCGLIDDSFSLSFFFPSFNSFLYFSFLFLSQFAIKKKRLEREIKLSYKNDKLCSSLCMRVTNQFQLSLYQLSSVCC